MTDDSRFFSLLPSWEEEWGWHKWADPLFGMLGDHSHDVTLKRVTTPNGIVCSLHVPGELTDELREKLKTIKGQEPFIHYGIPIFYCENIETPENERPKC